MDKLRIPETALVHSFLQHCSTPTDVDAALAVLTRLRTLVCMSLAMNSRFERSENAV